jgi:hypothetical protein
MKLDYELIHLYFVKVHQGYIKGICPACDKLQDDGLFCWSCYFKAFGKGSDSEGYYRRIYNEELSPTYERFKALCMLRELRNEC